MPKWVPLLQARAVWCCMFVIRSCDYRSSTLLAMASERSRLLFQKPGLCRSDVLFLLQSAIITANLAPALLTVLTFWCCISQMQLARACGTVLFITHYLWSRCWKSHIWHRFFLFWDTQPAFKESCHHGFEIYFPQTLSWVKLDCWQVSTVKHAGSDAKPVER